MPSIERSAARTNEVGAARSEVVVPFDSPTIIGMAIRSKARLHPAERRDLAIRLLGIPDQDAAAARLVADFLLHGPA